MSEMSITSEMELHAQLRKMLAMAKIELRAEVALREAEVELQDMCCQLKAQSAGLRAATELLEAQTTEFAAATEVLKAQIDENVAAFQRAQELMNTHKLA